MAFGPRHRCRPLDLYLLSVCGYPVPPSIGNIRPRWPLPASMANRGLGRLTLCIGILSRNCPAMCCSHGWMEEGCLISGVKLKCVGLSESACANVWSNMSGLDGRISLKCYLGGRARTHASHFLSKSTYEVRRTVLVFNFIANMQSSFHDFSLYFFLMNGHSGCW